MITYMSDRKNQLATSDLFGLRWLFNRDRQMVDSVLSNVISLRVAYLLGIQVPVVSAPVIPVVLLLSSVLTVMPV